ncbi:DcaP family trimeric outer membrane transporter [Faecalibacter macacae]|uniref:Porin n=1 Tax=Faecalibacter macacae TaxID=1859289 RepID=A0A3L9MB84_9FLAO|nr:DcaP family trimeric outer membrane transporter [Faecalibacter macacae]RLZ09226.1 hypothetical protein EAH69_08370 [Faecalibacter macacae]
MKSIFLYLFICISVITRAQNLEIIIDSIPQTKKTIDQEPTKPWELDFSGFIQADVIFDNKKLDYIDGYFPTYMESNKTEYYSYFTMRQSQLGLGITNNETGIRGFVQIDFIGPNNKTEPRLRKLFITYKNWMIGQDWSNVNDLDTWANLLDFNGPNAALYTRKMQIRYTKEINSKNQFSIALEDPNTPSITLPENELGWKKQNLLPNLVGAYKYGEKSYIRTAAFLSPISYQKRNNTEEELEVNTTLGIGVHASSVLYVDKLSNFKLIAAAGNGTATNVISFNEEGYDAVPDTNNQNRLKKLNFFSTVLAYEHWWNQKWSSVAFYSGSFLGKEKYATEGILKKVQHIGINTVYQPTNYFRTGFDLTYGVVDRHQLSNKTESARLQFSAVFSF